MIKSDGFDGPYVLYHKTTGMAVQIGDTVKAGHGATYIVQGGIAPHKPGSTGRVHVTATLAQRDLCDAYVMEHYPTNYDFEWRHPAKPGPVEMFEKAYPTPFTPEDAPNTWGHKQMESLTQEVSRLKAERAKMQERLRESTTHLCISASELKRAYRDLETAEARGFNACVAVLKITSVGPLLVNNNVDYSDLIDRAYSGPENQTLHNWGRFSGISAHCQFKDGMLAQLDK